MRLERRVIAVRLVEHEEVRIGRRSMRPIRDASGLGAAHRVCLLDEQRGERVAPALRRPDPCDDPPLPHVLSSLSGQTPTAAPPLTPPLPPPPSRPAPPTAPAPLL